MSNRNLDHPYVVGKRIITISGSFVPLTGAGTIDATKVTGLGFGFAPVNGKMALRAQPQNNPTPLTTPGILRTGTGVYTIVTEDPYIELVGFTADLAPAVTGSQLWAAPVEPVTGLNTAFTGVTATILLMNNAGTPTDASASQRVYFELRFRDSTTGYNKP